MFLLAFVEVDCLPADLFSTGLSNIISVGTGEVCLLFVCGGLSGQLLLLWEFLDYSIVLSLVVYLSPFPANLGVSNGWQQRSSEHHAWTHQLFLDKLPQIPSLITLNRRGKVYGSRRQILLKINKQTNKQGFCFEGVQMKETLET